MEVVRTFNSTEEYINFINQSKVDEMYKEAIDNAVDNQVTKEMLLEAIIKVADTEAELSILEDLFIQGKVDKKEVTQAKRRNTQARNEVENLYKEMGCKS